MNLISPSEAENSKVRELFDEFITTQPEESRRMYGHHLSSYRGGFEAANTVYQSEIIPVLEKCMEAFEQSNKEIWDILTNGTEGNFLLRSQYDKNREVISQLNNLLK